MQDVSRGRKEQSSATGVMAGQAGVSPVQIAFFTAAGEPTGRAGTLAGFERR
jgi:hypothetical protein